jgi:hypothetical protein
LDYETLVHLVEANFYQKHKVSGKICKVYQYYLPHAVLNPEGSGKDFSHFLAPGYYVHVMPIEKLEALADNDNFRMHKKQRLIDPSGKLSDEFAAAGIRLGQKRAQAASSKPAATSA